MQDRTPAQRIQFNIAMWENALCLLIKSDVLAVVMTRLYAFSEWEVTVDPIVSWPDELPADP
eukprot:3686392-Prymnesium_polylepis.1